MTINTENQTIEQIQNLKPFLPDKTQEELDKILAYWEKIKKEWVRKKKEWWIKYSREDFKKLLLYNQKYRDELEWKYEFLDKMAWVEREKFIEEYLYDDMLYSWKFDEIEIQEKTYYYYNAWAKWNFLMEEWMTWDLSINNISDDVKEELRNWAKSYKTDIRV